MGLDNLVAPLTTALLSTTRARPAPLPHCSSILFFIQDQQHLPLRAAMGDRTASPQRSPGLRRIKAMPSKQLSSPITPGPNAFAQRLAALEAKSSPPEQPAADAQRSSKGSSQRRMPTPTSLSAMSSMSQQTQWPLSETPPIGFDVVRRSDPVHAVKKEKMSHRPTASNDEKLKAEKLQLLSSPDSEFHPTPRSSTDTKDERLKRLIRDGGSHIANVRTRTPTPAPLNLQSTKAFGQSLNSNLHAVRYEPSPSSSKKTLRDRLAESMLSLKPTPTHAPRAPEPMKLNRDVPPKAAQLLGTKPSSHRLASSVPDKTPLDSVTWTRSMSRTQSHLSSLRNPVPPHVARSWTSPLPCEVSTSVSPPSILLRGFDLVKTLQRLLRKAIASSDERGPSDHLK